jgi:hypothetical protein
MAEPGSFFEGHLRTANFSEISSGANASTEVVLASHRRYAETAGLRRVAAAVENLQSELARAREGSAACVLPLGQAAGFLSKTVLPERLDGERRQVLRRVSALEGAVRTGLPFPKTRRVVYEGGEPSTLAGWVRFEALALLG